MERHPKVEITRLHSIIKDIHLTRRMVTERRQIRTRLHLTNTHTALDLQVHLQVGRRRPADLHLVHHLDMVDQDHLIVMVIHLEATLHLRKLQATRQDQEGLHQILWHRHLEITLILEVNMDLLLRPQLLDLRLQMQLHHLHHRLRPQLHRLRQLLHRRQLHLRQQLKLNKGHPVVRHQVQHLLLHLHLPLPIDLPMLLRPNTLREPIALTDPRLVGHQMHLHLIPEFQLNLLPVHPGTTHPHPMVVPIHITTKVQVLTHPLINLIPIQATTSILQAILDRLDLQILKAHHLLKDIHKAVIIRIIHQVVTTLRLMALLPRSIIKDIRHMDSMVLHHLKWASLVMDNTDRRLREVHIREAHIRERHRHINTLVTIKREARTRLHLVPVAHHLLQVHLLHLLLLLLEHQPRRPDLLPRVRHKSVHSSNIIAFYEQNFSLLYNCVSITFI